VYEMADALLYAWYPGEQGGAAVADIIFGDEVPSGRLPVTFPKSVDDLPPYEDYSMTGRTYRYMEIEPLFPFGFGLSYSQFEYSDFKLSETKIKKSETISASATIKNIGSVKSDEVVQLYITDVEASTRVPIYALKGFQRVTLNTQESRVVTFEISPGAMEIVDEEGKNVLEKGDFKVYISGSTPSGRSLDLGSTKWVEGTFTVK